MSQRSEGFQESQPAELTEFPIEAPMEAAVIQGTPTESPPTAASSKKGSGPRQVSKVWNHFTKIEVSEGVFKDARCNHCHKTLSWNNKSGTSSLGKHLRGRCPQFTPDDDSASYSRSPRSESKCDRMKSRRDSGVACIKHEYPFNIDIDVEHQHSEGKLVEECSVAASDCITSEKGKRKNGLNLSLEVFKPHFGKNLSDVAEELGVGRSTIKRACRDCGIDRWPTKEKYENNPSVFEGESSMNLQRPLTSNLQPLETNAESTGHLIVHKEMEKVIIKVKYGEDIIKFELFLWLGLAKLMEEVAAGLNLAIGTFRLKYLDEDGDEILLTRDVDLELCRKSQIRMDKTFIQLFVR